jgi:hypothetical protein
MTRTKSALKGCASTRRLWRKYWSIRRAVEAEGMAAKLHPGQPPGNKGGNAMIRTGQPFDADDQMHLNLPNVHVGMSLQVDDK